MKATCVSARRAATLLDAPRWGDALMLTSSFEIGESMVNCRAKCGRDGQESRSRRIDAESYGTARLELGFITHFSSTCLSYCLCLVVIIEHHQAKDIFATPYHDVKACDVVRETNSDKYAVEINWQMDEFKKLI